MIKLRRLLLVVLLIFAIALDVSADSEYFKGTNKIAFSSNYTGKYHIYIINDDGKELIKLSKNDKDNLRPYWSPDGKKILYYSGNHKMINFNTKYDLYIVDINDKESIQLATDIDTSFIPQWSKDGKKVMIVQKKDNEDCVSIVNIDGSGVEYLDTEYAAWSPDNTKIVYYQKNDNGKGIFIMNSDGSNIEQLVSFKGSSDEIKWSPDGKYIAYAYIAPFFNFFGKDSGIYLINLNTGEEEYIREGDNISWCPDSTSFAFIDTYSESYGNSKDATVYTYHTTLVYSIETRKSYKIITPRSSFHAYPVWSYDGNKLAYKTDSTLYVMESGKEGEYAINIPSSSFIDTPPSWSSDNNKLTFIGYPKFISNKTNLYILDLRDNDIYKLNDENLHNIYTPVISPVTYVNK